jgi:hypothetical protein
MHIVEIFLPLTDNQGNAFGAELFGKVRAELVERFGGLTAFTRSPAEGIWEEGGEVTRDEIVIFEVMADSLDRRWWQAFRRRLDRNFRQEEIVVRAQEAERL